MDALDRSITLELQRDARKNDAQIARVLGISGVSVRRRIKRMVDDGVFNVVAVTNPRKVGYDTSAIIGIQVQPDKVDEVAACLISESSVHTVTLATGPFDFLVWVTFRSQEELAGFVKSTLFKMPGVVRSETMLLLRVIKRSQNILEDPEGSDLPARVRIKQLQPSADLDVDETPAQIDDLDHRLIIELQENARQSDAALGRKLGISDVTVRRRLSRLTSEGVVKISLVSIPAKLGYLVTANFGLQMDLSRVSHALQVLKVMPQVHYLGMTTGRYDIWVWSAFRTSKELADFLQFELAKVPGMLRSETLVHLEIRKRGRSVLQPKPAST